MPTKPLNGKFETHGTYGASTKFTRLNEELNCSAAFICLRPVEQMILLDFIKHYDQRTDYDRKHDAALTRVLYTYGMCALTVAKNTFYRSMISLQEHGFILPEYTGEQKRGSATRWLSCTRWRSWSPTTAQLRILNNYNSRRSSSAENPNQTRFPFVQNLNVMNYAHRNGNGNVTHIAQDVTVAVEELWTRNGSRRQAQR
jgi:hypothetical protein